MGAADGVHRIGPAGGERERQRHVVVFTHHPPFLVYLEEANNWLVLPPERRLPLVDLFLETGVTHVFSGHWHRNHHGYFGSLEVVVTSSVGYPLGPDPSGLRVCRSATRASGTGSSPWTTCPTA